MFTFRHIKEYNMSRDSRGRLLPSYTEQFDENLASNRSRSRSGGMPSRSQGLVSPQPGEDNDDHDDGRPRSYATSVLDMEDETSGLPSSSFLYLPRDDLQHQPATDSAMVQSPRAKKVKKFKKKRVLILMTTHLLMQVGQHIN